MAEAALAPLELKARHFGVLAALAPLELKARHLGVLVALEEHEPAAQHELGQLLRIDRTTIVAIVDHLERLAPVGC